jgi:hypothetical protein
VGGGIDDPAQSQFGHGVSLGRATDTGRVEQRPGAPPPTYGVGHTGWSAVVVSNVVLGLAVALGEPLAVSSPEDGVAPGLAPADALLPLGFGEGLGVSGSSARSFAHISSASGWAHCTRLGFGG